MQCNPDDLTRRAKEGDPKLLEDLFSCYRDDLMGFLRRRCGDTNDAEDAAQDAFLNAARYLEGFRGDAPIRSWLYRLASSACTKMRRGTKGDKSRHVGLESIGLVSDGTSAEDGKANVESMLEARLSPIQSALGALGDTDRAVLLLRDGQGMSAKEVADELKLTEGAVKSRLHRARKTIRAALAED